MTNEELNTALYEKLFAEQQDFKGWLVKQPPEEILKHAYEYVIREDIIIEMEYHDLTDEEAKALLADKKPLQSIYNIYEDLEGGHMDEIRDCIESRARTCIAEQREALRSLPVYIFSATFAQEHGELDEYRASFRANVECKNAIEEAIADHYSNNRFDGSCVQEVVDRFGADRVSFVLANTIQQMLIAVNIVVLDIFGRNLIKEFSCTGNLRFFNGLQAQAFHRTLSLSDKVDMFYRSLVESDCPVGRIVSDRSRNMESSRQLCIHAYFFGIIQVLGESALHAFFGVAVGKYVVLNMLCRLESLVNARRGLFGSKDGAVILSFDLVVRNKLKKRTA